MTDFTNEDLFMLEKMCVRRIQCLESVYRDNVNFTPDYAVYIGELATKYFRLLLKIHPGYVYITESDSFHTYLCA